MPKMAVKVVKNNVAAVGAAMVREANAIVNHERGPEMVGIAQSHARVDTGEMRDGIHWVDTGQGTGELQGSTDHDIYNELGTVDLPAQPMFRPAADEVFPQVLSDLGRLEGRLPS